MEYGIRHPHPAERRKQVIISTVVLALIVLMGAIVLYMKFVARDMRPVEEKPGYIRVGIQDLKKNPGKYHNRRIAVEGVYRWGLEDSSLGNSTDEEYSIWIEVIATKTVLEHRPENFDYNEHLVYVGGEGSREVAIQGIFHASDAATRGYGHFGFWEHEIVADRIIFSKENGSRSFKNGNPPFPIQIKGNGEFIALTIEALDVFEQYAPVDLAYIEKYVNVIWNLRASGTNSPAGEVAVSNTYAQTGRVRYALMLLHEACHVQVCRDDLFVCVGSSREEERYCLLRERKAFDRIKNSISIPDYLRDYYKEENIERLLDTEWWRTSFPERGY